MGTQNERPESEENRDPIKLKICYSEREARKNSAIILQIPSKCLLNHSTNSVLAEVGAQYIYTYT